MIKTSILPRIMFLFQTMPILIIDVPFKQWQKVMFAWQGNKRRVKYKILQDTRK